VRLEIFSASTTGLTVGALELSGAPWVVIVVVSVIALLIAGLRVIIPQDSKDKLELWRTLLARSADEPSTQPQTSDVSKVGGEGDERPE
jgi:hypothetical protein